MVDSPERTRLEEPARVPHRRNLAVVEPDDRADARSVHGRCDLRRLLWDAPYGLLDPEVLARLRRGDRNVAMELIGSGDADGLDLGVFNDFAPARDPVLEAQGPQR